MAYWILPAFLLSIGAGPATLGLIEGSAESVASFAKLFSGYLTDRLRRRKALVVAGYAVANAAKPLLALTNAWWQVLLIRFADRLAKGVRGTPRDVMVAESVDKNRIGSAFGLLQAMDSAGAIAGPLLGLVFNIVYTASAWPAGKLADRLPKRPIASAGYLVFAAVYFVFALAPSRSATWIAMASYGLFYALTNPVLRALVVDTVAPEV